jgi:hypothetical protein
MHTDLDDGADDLASEIIDDLTDEERCQVVAATAALLPIIETYGTQGVFACMLISLRYNAFKRSLQ